MQDPRSEIAQVISLLTTAKSPEVQQATVHKFFTPNAAFRHPVCAVSPGPNSRENILAIYQWYRIMSPEIELDVKNVVFDEAQKLVMVEVVQKFKLRLSPFAPLPSRLIVRLTLEKEAGLYFIALQEDFYHPDELAALILPPLTPFVKVALSAAGLISAFNAKVAQVVGFWRPGLHHNNKDAY